MPRERLEEAKAPCLHGLFGREPWVRRRAPQEFLQGIHFCITLVLGQTSGGLN